MSFSSKITWSILMSLVLRHLTRASINLFPSLKNIQMIWWWQWRTGVFIDISKAFDKVWHQGLHYKLRQNNMSVKLLTTLTYFLDNRAQRVILNGQYSLWNKVETRVPQGSILEPLLFLVYINDLSENLASNPKLLLMAPHSSL